MNALSRREALRGFGTAALALPAITGIPSLAFAQGSSDEYVTKTLEAGMFSLKSSEMALQKSSSDIVTSFANLESAEQKAVATVLGSTGAEPPAAMNAEHQSLIDELMGTEGGDFDAAYIDGQIEGHQELLEIQQMMADMSDVTIPVATAKLGMEAIKTHLAVLEGIRRSV